MASPLFLMWYDDNPKLSVAHKVEDAAAAYAARFNGLRPNLVLLNEAELLVLEGLGLEVRGTSTVPRNTYWVGFERREIEAAAA